MNTQLNKEWQPAALIATDENGIIDYKWLCDLYPPFSEFIMNTSATKIVKRLDVTKPYAQSLQHYAWNTFVNERIKQLNK